MGASTVGLRVENGALKGSILEFLARTAMTEVLYSGESP